MDSIDRMRIALIIAALLAGISALAQPINRNPWTTNSAVVVSNLTLGLIRDNGSIITNLNANNISSGTFSGNGSGLTNLYKSTNHVVAIAGANITLTTNSTGGVTAYTVASSGGGTPGGANTQVQYNDGGAFGGDAGLTYDEGTDSLTIGGNVTLAGSISHDAGFYSIDAGGAAFFSQGAFSIQADGVLFSTIDGNFGGNIHSGANIDATGIFHGDGSGISNVVLRTTAGSAVLTAGGQVSVNTTDKLLGIHNGTKEVALSLIQHREFSFDPKAVCDGAVDRLFLFKIGAWAPKGITITGWRASFEADPTTEVDLDLKRADAFIGVANSAVMDVLDTTAGASSETSAANINGGAVVANGKVIYLEFGTAYTETTHQIIFEIEYEIEED